MDGTGQTLREPAVPDEAAQATASFALWSILTPLLIVSPDMELSRACVFVFID